MSQPVSKFNPDTMTVKDVKNAANTVRSLIEFHKRCEGFVADESVDYDEETMIEDLAMQVVSISAFWVYE